MTEAEKLLALAERAERATGDDCELYEDVWRVVFPDPERIWITDNTGDPTPEYVAWNRLQVRFYGFMEAGAFLDAAMTLNPSEWLTVELTIGRHTSYAELNDVPADEGWGCSVASTPALALTAACLRARARGEG